MRQKGGFVKITGGQFRGQKIRTPGEATHPMGERERLALFNILTGQIEGASVLDAFAGSGILGIEAISRNASKVIFVEKNSVALHGIIDSCLWLGVSGEKVDFYHGTVASFCEKMTHQTSDWLKFDVVLADPPYDNFDLSEVECLKNLVLKGGTLVLSHPGEAPVLPGFTLVKTRVYAAARLSFYDKD